MKNTLIVLRQVSINGILAIGMTFVIITAGVDLSVGSVLALSGSSQPVSPPTTADWLSATPRPPSWRR
ncbi:Ribose transport system permease protein rbsC [Serratia marcescens]|uniref:Ribose transport system permease protein rbsC n=1 Tax=Serratia marcescens TaxID=615 RepID=A0A379ZCJ0_SERMA|nr:Ribose transport system permease protein rbsC [Serratia marcescens]